MDPNFPAQQRAMFPNDGQPSNSGRVFLRQRTWNQNIPPLSPVQDVSTPMSPVDAPGIHCSILYF